MAQGQGSLPVAARNKDERVRGCRITRCAEDDDSTKGSPMGEESFLLLHMRPLDFLLGYCVQSYRDVWAL